MQIRRQTCKFKRAKSAKQMGHMAGTMQTKTREDRHKFKAAPLRKCASRANRNNEDKIAPRIALRSKQRLLQSKQNQREKMMNKPRNKVN